jgi:ATP-dependent Clp protease adaptor protein ClpS
MSTVIQNQRALQSDVQPTRLAPPPMYQVVLLNDDYTPMDFVVRVLEVVFHKTDAEAERIMLQVHHQGRGICGIYTRDVASTRVDRVLRMAHAGQHPLQCLMEPVPAP